MNINKLTKLNLSRPIAQRIVVADVVADINERVTSGAARSRGDLLALHVQIHGEAQATLAGEPSWDKTFSTRYRSTI